MRVQDSNAAYICNLKTLQLPQVSYKTQKQSYTTARICLVRILPSQNASVRSYGDNPLLVRTNLHSRYPSCVSFTNMCLLSLVVLPHLTRKVEITYQRKSTVEITDLASFLGHCPLGQCPKN